VTSFGSGVLITPGVIIIAVSLPGLKNHSTMAQGKPLHANFDEFDIAVYHLVFLGNTIENTIKSFASIIDKVADADERAIWVATCSIVLIQTVSFLEEFDNFVVSKDEGLNDTVNAIKRAVKPAAKQIREWKELTDFRNAVLAHNLRDKKMQISVFDRGLNSYDIPKTGADFTVLSNCISMIKKTFSSGFAGKLQGVQDFLDQQVKASLPNRFNNGPEAAATIDRLANEINHNIRELKKSAGVINPK
jgi:hypothetical protein